MNRGKMDGARKYELAMEKRKHNLSLGPRPLRYYETKIISPFIPSNANIAI